MGWKVPPKVEADCLRLAGYAAGPGRGKPELVEAAHVPGSGVWRIPLETVSEVNSRLWQGRNRRAGVAWKAVRKAIKNWELVMFETNIERNRPVHATFTRLGGRRLDRGNLPSALKGVEDATAFLVGVDDGSPLWIASFEQEPGGALGVRIELTGG